MSLDVRASDGERAATADRLREHWLSGRITLEELEERLQAAMSATTCGDLERITADLPAPRANPSASTTARTGPPGIRPFTVRASIATSPERTRRHILEKLAPGLNSHGYELVAQSPGRLLFRRAERPRWAPLAVLGAFPLGLLALGLRDEHRIAMALEPTPAGGTVLLVHGSAPRSIRKVFGELAAE